MPGSSSTIRMRAPAVVMSIVCSMAAMLNAAGNIWISRLKSPTGPSLGEGVVGNERVRLPLLAEGRHRPVTRHEADVVAQRPEPRGDRLDQLGVVAAREVGAPDRALEKHVADLGEPRLAVEEDHMPGRVAGAVVDLELRLAEGNLIAVVEPAVGREAPRARHAPLGRRGLDLVDPEGVVGVRSLDGDP